MLVIFNHYLAFQYFAEEYYLFSEVRGWGRGEPGPSSCCLGPTVSINVTNNPKSIAKIMKKQPLGDA